MQGNFRGSAHQKQAERSFSMFPGNFSMLESMFFPRACHGWKAKHGIANALQHGNKIFTNQLFFIRNTTILYKRSEHNVVVLVKNGVHLT